jgi:hypothetical protein
MSAATPLLRACVAAGARETLVHGRRTGDGLAPAAGALYLADLSALPKLLVAGRTATEQLAALALPVPGLMRKLDAPDGAFVACRAPRQFVIGVGRTATVPAGPLRFDGVDFALGGGHGADGVDDLLDEACPTDLAQFGADAYVPTLLFGVEVGLWRVASGHWRAIAAPADGEFLAATLLDAVQRRRGGLAGCSDYFAMITT